MHQGSVIISCQGAGIGGFWGSHGFGGGREGGSVVANRVYRGDYRKLTANLLPVKKGGFVTVKKGGGS